MDNLVILIALLGIIMIISDKHEHFHIHTMVIHAHPIIQYDPLHRNIKLLSEEDNKKAEENEVHVNHPIKHAHEHSNNLHHDHNHNKDN